MMNTKIFVIEDERELADLLANILVEEGFSVHTFYSGTNALKKFQTVKPDLILMDLMLPDKSGLQLCKEIKDKQDASDIPIIVLSARSDEYDILNAFSFGCADYITKPFNEKILLARIKACLEYKSKKLCSRSCKNCEKNDLKFEGLEINPDRYEVYVNDKFVDFTPLEFKLLYFLAKNLGKVFTRLQIFEEIYEDYYNRGDRAIDILVNRIRKKLQDYGDSIETVYGVGYSFKFKSLKQASIK